METQFSTTHILTIISIFIAVLSLIVSGTVTWLTLIRKGKISMTQPMAIFVEPNPQKAKIFFRTSLYVTGKRGRVVENMFVRLRRARRAGAARGRGGETQQTFNYWLYGDEEPLKGGSGFVVPETGFATNHHFLLPPDGTSFSFLPGHYDLEIYCNTYPRSSAALLQVVSFEITSDLYVRFSQPGHGLYLDWGPEESRYFAHVRAPPDAVGR